MKIILILLTLTLSTSSWAQKKGSSNRQEVVFEGAEVDGQGRSPDGAYLVQKRGIDFEPLYKVKRALKNNIRDSVEYLR
jgi:hypothetical protein